MKTFATAAVAFALLAATGCSSASDDAPTPAAKPVPTLSSDFPTATLLPTATPTQRPKQCFVIGTSLTARIASGHRDGVTITPGHALRFTPAPRTGVYLLSMEFGVAGTNYLGTWAITGPTTQDRRPEIYAADATARRYTLWRNASELRLKDLAAAVGNARSCQMM